MAQDTRTSQHRPDSSNLTEFATHIDASDPKPAHHLFSFSISAAAWTTGIRL